MAMPAILLVVFLVSALTSLAVAGRLTRVAVTERILEDGRTLSASATPRVGGAAVFAAILIGILAAVTAKASVSGAVPELPELAKSLIVASAILFLVGLFDDLRGVPPLAKLAAQTAAATIVWNAGFTIEHVSIIPGHTLHLGILALPVTILWLVGVSNAFNLIDGMDGLAGGVAIVALVSTAAAALFLGNPSIPIYCVALIAALLGFLRYNWPSARLFMGDSGSLVIGFLIAIFAVKGATDPRDLTYGLVPLFALAYPLLDTGIAILRRWLRGVPISRADRRHVHHQLRSVGLSPKKALLAIYAAASVVAVLGLLGAFAPPEVTFVTTVLSITAFIGIVALSLHRLQYHEFVEAGSSVAHAARNGRSVIRDKINARDIAAVIRQANTLEEVQAILEDSASTFRFAYMKLATPHSRRALPTRISQELQALKLWKLEYPIVHTSPEDYDGLCLTIWCALEVAQHPAGAERIAQIIGPAIAEWATSGRLKPAVPSYGDRLLHVEYTPLPTPVDVVSTRVLTDSVRWNPVTEERLSS